MMRRTVSVAVGLAATVAVIYGLAHLGAAVNGLAILLAAVAGVLATKLASWAWTNQAAAHRAVRDDIGRFLAEDGSGTAEQSILDTASAAQVRL